MTVALGTSMPTSITVVATRTSASPLAKRGDVERAERREAQRARDRRRREMQHVRDEPGRRLGVERGALAHAEAVLLVDHRHGEAVEPHGVLDQRVRADDQPELAAREL